MAKNDNLEMALSSCSEETLTDISLVLGVKIDGKNKKDKIDLLNQCLRLESGHTLGNLWRKATRNLYGRSYTDILYDVAKKIDNHTGLFGSGDSAKLKSDRELENFIWKNFQERLEAFKQSLKNDKEAEQKVMDSLKSLGLKPTLDIADILRTPYFILPLVARVGVRTGGILTFVVDWAGGPAYRKTIPAIVLLIRDRIVREEMSNII